MSLKTSQDAISTVNLKKEDNTMEALLRGINT